MASTPPATLADAGAMPADVEALADQVPGARAHSPLDMPPSAWWAIIKRVYVMNGVHNLALLAAGVAFFVFLAFVPLIAVIVLLYGLIADPGTVANSLDLLNDVVPSEVLVILREQLLQIVTTSSTQQGLGLVLALLFSTYGAMRAATGTQISAGNWQCSIMACSSTSLVSSCTVIAVTPKLPTCGSARTARSRSRSLWAAPLASAISPRPSR